MTILFGPSLTYQLHKHCVVLQQNRLSAGFMLYICRALSDFHARGFPSLYPSAKAVMYKTGTFLCKMGSTMALWKRIAELMVEGYRAAGLIYHH